MLCPCIPAGLHWGHALGIQGHALGIQGHPWLGDSTGLSGVDGCAGSLLQLKKTHTGVRLLPGNVLENGIRKEEGDLSPG